MSLLKIFSDFKSFKDFKTIDGLFPFSIYDKDESRNKLLKFNRFRISFRTSIALWDNLDSQILDTKNFLLKNRKNILSIFDNYNVVTSYVAFPIFSRIDNKIVNQNDYFPSDFIKIVGDLGIGLQLSIYDKKYLDIEKMNDIDKLLVMHDKAEN